MSIATASEAEVRAVYDLAIKTEKALQEYVQGNANGTQGTLGRYTEAEIDELLVDLEAAAAVVSGSGGGV